jgi:ferredoxin
MKATVDETCTACGLCVETCPEVFELPEGADIARVKVGQVPAGAEDCCRQAADECPVDAIHIEE